jgi:hypothetical protein
MMLSGSKLTEPHASTAIEAISTPVFQRRDELDELADGFDREDLCGRCGDTAGLPIGVRPLPRELHRRSVRQTDNEVLLAGLEYLDLLITKRMVRTGDFHPERTIFQVILSL